MAHEQSGLTALRYCHPETSSANIAAPFAVPSPPEAPSGEFDAAAPASAW
jgi:hypothetical protein